MLSTTFMRRSTMRMAAFRRQGALSAPAKQQRRLPFSSTAATTSSVSDPDILFKKFDEDDDGKLNKDQFRAALAQWSSPQMATLKRSLSRNELSQSTDEDSDASKKSIGELLPNRFTVTAEVVASKIFMAGFGWQGFSVLADLQGHGADTLPFALYTGVGDFCGVFLGHSLYMAGKSMASDNIKLGAEVQTGFLLGSAAFCSGTAWQPTVNLAHDILGMDFTGSASFTWAVCGMAFYGGLRLGRKLYSGFLKDIEANNYANLKADAALSLSVGAACGAFVGTDLSFADSNWLAGIVGVKDTYGTLHGMALAGTSTALGFSVVQAVQNLLVKPGHNWVD